MRPLVILLALLELPSALRYFLPVSSFAAGVTVACAVTLLLIRWRVKHLPSGARVSAGVLLLAVGVLVAVHLCIAAWIVPVDWLRALTSLPVALLVIGTAIALSPMVFGQQVGLDLTARTAFAILLISAVLGMTGFNPPEADWNSPAFPFTEPSHFALAFTPLLLWASVSSSGTRRALCLLGGLGIAAAMPSLTLLLGVLLIATICLPIWQLSLAIGVCVAGSMALAPDLGYFLDRIDLLSDVTNLSSLVWLQGWELAWEAISETRGWGVGFQQLGIATTSAEAASTINSLAGGDLNLLDGGFNFAKLAGEFGAFGVAAVAAYLVNVVSAMRKLRAHSFGLKKEASGTLLAMSFVVAYTLELFVRGGGYFSGTSVLALAALVHLAREARIRKRHSRKAAHPSVKSGVRPLHG